MAPTKEQEQQQQVATEKQQQEQEEIKMPSPIIDKPTLVVLEDGRQVAGHLIAFDSTGSVLLQNCIERKQVKEGLVVQRSTVSLSIPASRMKAFYQRDEVAPEMKEIEERHEAIVKEMKEKSENANNTTKNISSSSDAKQE